jgi:hypothetical protein
MTVATEATFRNAVSVAEGVRQQSKAAAKITYADTPANLAAYIVALADADVAYITAVNSAANTSDLQLGNVAHLGPVPTTWAALV